MADDVHWDGQAAYLYLNGSPEPAVFSAISADGVVRGRGHLMVYGAGAVLFTPLVPQSTSEAPEEPTNG